MATSKNVKLFTSDTYSRKILQNFYDLWQAEYFTDVQIHCSGEVFQVHRTILSSSSNYFRAMFTGTMKESKNEVIVLKNISSHVFSTLLNFIYTGQIFLSQSTVQEVLVGADILCLPEVIESCTEYLKTELDPGNAIGIYEFADTHSCEELKKYSLSYIYRNFPQIVEEDEFLIISKARILQFLESEKLKVDSEWQVLQCALRWLNYSISDRRPNVFDILKFIRFPLISSKLIQLCDEHIEDGSIKIALKTLYKDAVNKKTNLLCGISHPRRSAKKYIYVIGGSRKEIGTGWKQLSESTMHTVECFDTFKKTWTRASSMEIERILPGVASLEGLIYVIGGEQESKILANGEVYYPQEDMWNFIQPMKIPRCAFGLAAWENYLYAFGGWVGEDIGGSIERYDPNLNEWTMIGDMEEPRFSMGVFTQNGLIYLLGGCTHSHRHLRDLSSYNPFTSEWTKLSPMKVSRSQMGFAILNNTLYVVGGSSKHAEVLKSVEKYSFELDTWTDICQMNYGRANPAVGAADGKIYAIGGDQTHESNFFRAQVTLNSSEVYDPLTDSWEECVSLPESRSEAGVVVI